MEKAFHTVSDPLFEQLKNSFSKEGKNSHIGHWAVAIAKEYILTVMPEATIALGSGGGDIDVIHQGQTLHYEVKGTESSNIAFDKLRVSSRACYESLIAGMTILRVCNIGQRNVTIFLLKYGEDFLLREEPRWIITPVKRARQTGV